MLDYHPPVVLIEGSLLTLGILAATWIALIAIIWLHRPSRALAGPALRLIPDLIRLVRSLIGDPATPLRVKVALGGLLVYLLSPVDLIPDFIPVLGEVDDLAVTAIVLRWAKRCVAIDDLRAHWTGSDPGFDLLRRLLGR